MTPKSEFGALQSAHARLPEVSASAATADSRPFPAIRAWTCLRPPSPFSPSGATCTEVVCAGFAVLLDWNGPGVGGMANTRPVQRRMAPIAAILSLLNMTRLLRGEPGTSQDLYLIP